jgi:two-component system OmpR family response regulator
MKRLPWSNIMAENTRIIVAEDSAQVRELIRAHLQAQGYEVLGAGNGVDAVRLVYSHRPAAMILDINMPQMDGFATLEDLAKRGRMLPVLVLTARHAEDDVRRAVALGAKDYLTKPFSEKQLQQRVARLLRPSTPRAAEGQAPTAA